MVKNIIISVLISLMPIFLVITVYRYTLGYNPLNFRLVVDLLSSSFADTGNVITELLSAFSTVYGEAVDIADSIRQAVGAYTGIGFIDSLLNFLALSTGQIIASIKHSFMLAILLGRLVFALFGDFLKGLDILYKFLIDSSPYLVDPYFPVGG